jgi:hypothetical protein
MANSLISCLKAINMPVEFRVYGYDGGVSIIFTEPVAFVEYLLKQFVQDIVIVFGDPSDYYMLESKSQKCTLKRILIDTNEYGQYYIKGELTEDVSRKAPWDALLKGLKALME